MIQRRIEKREREREIVKLDLRPSRVYAIEIGLEFKWNQNEIMQILNYSFEMSTLSLDINIYTYITLLCVCVTTISMGCCVNYRIDKNKRDSTKYIQCFFIVQNYQCTPLLSALYRYMLCRKTLSWFVFNASFLFICVENLCEFLRWINNGGLRFNVI